MVFLIDHAHLQLFFFEADGDRGVLSKVYPGHNVEVDGNIQSQGSGMEKVKRPYINSPSSKVDAGRC